MKKNNKSKLWIVGALAIGVFSIALISGGGDVDQAKRQESLIRNTGEIDRDREKDVANQEKNEIVNDYEKEIDEVNERAEGVTSEERISPSGQLVAHFIDVGQGDAILLKGSDFTILIDAGRHTGNEVVPYLRSAGVTSVDLLIGTHPHADHIGQFPQVLKEFTVKEVWLDGNVHTSQTFERAIDAVLASNAKYHEPRTGETKRIGSAFIEVVHPNRLTGSLNDDSVSIRLRFGDIYFLFTGDAEVSAENAMARRDIKAHILKVGHHGSRTSSNTNFLQKVRPEVAIYSAGKGNTYGHPHQEALSRLSQIEARIYGTDINGTIKVITDGKTYSVQPSRGRAVSVTTPAPETSTPTTTAPIESCVDINNASREALLNISHIGESRVEDLISGRPYSSVDQLTRISGIGPARISDIKEQGLACVK